MAHTATGFKEQVWIVSKHIKVYYVFINYNLYAILAGKSILSGSRLGKKIYINVCENYRKKYD